MRSMLLYSFLIVLVVGGYPFVDSYLFHKFGIRDLHIFAITAFSSLMYIYFQFILATRTDLESRSKDDIGGFIPVITLIVLVLLMIIFYPKHLYQDWYYEIIVILGTLWTDIRLGNHIGNLLLKRTSNMELI